MREARIPASSSKPSIRTATCACTRISPGPDNSATMSSPTSISSVRTSSLIPKTTGSMPTTPSCGTGSGGVSYLWNGTRFSADLIYGSGLRSGFANTDHLPPYAQVNAGISHEYDIPGWSPVTLRFNVVNVFDTSYVLKNGTGIGVFANAYGPRIGYYFGLAQKFGPGAAAKKKPADKLPRLFRHPAGTIWTWAGFYVGGNVGYSISRFGNDTSFSDASVGTPLAAESSYVRHYDALGGGQAGYNWQLGMWVAGIEADMQFGHQRTTTGAGCNGTVCDTAFTPFDAPVTLIHEHNLDWFGTLRGRLGAAVP